MVIIGLSLFAFLAIRSALAVRNYFAATLRLSSEGFEIGKHTVAWTDVAAFRRGSRFIRVFYAPGHEPGRSATVTETLGKVGLYFPPTYLSVRYDTRGHDRGLYEILQHGHGRRDVAADPPPAV